MPLNVSRRPAFRSLHGYRIYFASHGSLAHGRIFSAQALRTLRLDFCSAVGSTCAAVSSAFRRSLGFARLLWHLALNGTQGFQPLRVGVEDLLA